MRRVDLFEAAMRGWSRLDPEQRERFFQAGLKAALRLDRRQFREWLLRRVRNPPLCAPVDLSRLLADADIALAIRTASDSGLADASPDLSRYEFRATNYFRYICNCCFTRFH
jgi:hypothetical protein